MDEPEYQVKSQQQFTQLNQDGSITPSVKVTVYDVPTQQTFYVTVPLSMYSADNVRAQIIFHLEQLRQVHGLTN